ncbi:Integral membrane protein [hydrothermal vent metagenome]|uniref:Integral membrane protein n=1 Tax=hydrothermal vent metagenome TaxID=652676 RepID=A0A3B0YM75_9ZZZZ
MINAALISFKSLIAKKPELSSFTLTLAVSLFLLLFSNYSFWMSLTSILYSSFKHYILFSITIFVVVLIYINTLLTFISFKYIQKPALIVILISSSFASYYMNSYGIVIDDHMITSMLETDTQEAFELVHFNLFATVFLLGIVPSIFVYRTNIKFKRIGPEIFYKLSVVVLSLIILGTSIYPFYQEYASLTRNNRILRHQINPANFIHAIRHKVRDLVQDNEIEVQAIGMDANHVHPVGVAKRSITIFVVGETARAKNFSLLGYKRNTNPLMSRQDIVAYSNVKSCGTSTAVSLPCMFSHKGRRQFSNSDGKRWEGLLDIVSRAGVKVLFRDNNSGCKGVCARVKTHNMMSLDISPYCNKGECYDEILLHKLQEYIQSTKGDLLVVLHQKGSHGPSYYQRYPKKFNQFVPLCATNQLQNCSKKDISNAYDNTILYTDYFLSKVLTLLKSNAGDSDGAMIYISDHGESLGGKGLYLHGLPYMIAPDEQKHVPMILWLSDSFKLNYGVNYQCLKSGRAKKLSHDNVFHTVLGLTAVKTHLYNKDLDILSNCTNLSKGAVSEL